MLTGDIDTQEWDEMLDRMMRAMTAGGIGGFAAKVLEIRIHDTYDYRWERALPEGNKGRYADFKSEHGLPVGTLTGSSRRAISSDVTDDGGMVYLEGRWPNKSIGMGEGYTSFPGFEEEISRLMAALSAQRREPESPDDDVAGFKWDTRGAWIPISQRGSDSKFTFIPSEAFSQKAYGAERGGAEIMWFEPLPGDEVIVGGTVGNLIEYLVDPRAGLPGLLSEVFD